jgi:hypothetical protein
VIPASSPHFRIRPRTVERWKCRSKRKSSRAGGRATRLIRSPRMQRCARRSRRRGEGRAARMQAAVEQVTRKHVAMSWMQRLKRVFAIERCRGVRPSDFSLLQPATADRRLIRCNCCHGVRNRLNECARVHLLLVHYQASGLSTPSAGSSLRSLARAWNMRVLTVLIGQPAMAAISS